MKKFILLLSLTMSLSIYSGLLSSATLVDVRTLEEWNEGHIDSAVRIEWAHIEDISNYAAKEERIYLYCRSGKRAERAKNILISSGYLDVINLGGLQEARAFFEEK